MKVGDKVVYAGNALGKRFQKDRVGRPCTLVQYYGDNFVIVAFPDRPEFRTQVHNLEPAKNHYLRLFKKLYHEKQTTSNLADTDK